MIDLGRYCLPNATAASDYIVKKFGNGDVGRYMGDIQTSWYIYLIMLGITTTIVLIYILLLKWIAKPMIYISIVITFALLVGGGFYAFYTSSKYNGSDRTKEIMKGMGILIWALALAFIVLVCFCCTTIRLAASIM
jgi:hypothetical protein